MKEIKSEMTTEIKIDTMNQTGRHLTNEQFVTLLISPGADHPHLRSCELCASQLEGLRSSIGDLRDASIVAAERHYRAAVRAQAAPRRTHRPRLAWAITAVAGVLFIGMPFAAKLRTPAHPPIAATPVAAPVTTASNLSSLSDDQLLNNIDSDLSASVPSPLLPLDSTSTTASTKETE
jgi:hypothetical protein